MIPSLLGDLKLENWLFEKKEAAFEMPMGHAPSNQRDTQNEHGKQKKQHVHCLLCLYIYIHTHIQTI